MPENRVSSIASAPLLLVAADFDGTLAPLAPTPDQARADPRSMAALARLARLPCTTVAIISGRPLAWLRDTVKDIQGALLFGSHGAEDGTLGQAGFDAAPDAQLEGIATALDAIAVQFAGCLVERKPIGVAFHFRRADSAAEGAIRDAVMSLAAGRPGILLRPGSKVYEVSVSHRNKGDAVKRAAYVAGATHTVFFGDDVTDEDAFAALGEKDLAVKVGDDLGGADVRAHGVAHVVELLELLAQAREAWFAKRAIVPIQTHSMLSDQRTLAVVTPAARITWLCLPRIDSPAMFAELLGGPRAGHFTVAPADAAPPVGQEYLSDTMLLRTRWANFSVTDYLDCAGGRAYQRAGRSDLVRVLEGRGRVRVVFAPRHDFARAATTLAPRDGGLEVHAGSDPCVLYAPGVEWTITPDGPHHTAEAIIDLDERGGSIAMELRFGTGNLRPAAVPEPERREQTRRHWAGWTGSLKLPKERRDLLARSAITIKSLCNGPAGAIVAAGTTSLPEQLGGIRNWDYRFCWPRDAAMAATALLRLGNTGHAMKLTDWLVGIVDRLESPEGLRPIYTVRGEDLGSEAEIGVLSGYADSRPVRLGNAAATQVQLDVFGPIVHMVACMTERGVAVSPDAWRLVRAMVHAVEVRWEEPDHGIWEIRGPRRHHVHSKVMCWHAVDRALSVHEAVVGRDHPDWRSLRDRIAADVLSRGWNAEAGAFTSYYGSPELDAAALAIGLCGTLPHQDERWRATVDAIDTHLRRGATVYRYRGDDGLPGSEGGFVICATWLVEALVTIGRTDDARQLFEAILAQAGPTGLFAEQWDPAHGIALGNFPQAYSHLGVINASLALAGTTHD